MPLSKSSSVPGIIWWIIPRHLSSSTKFIRYVWKCFFINLFVTAKVRLFRCQDKKRRSFPAAVVSRHAFFLFACAIRGLSIGRWQRPEVEVFARCRAQIKVARSRAAKKCKSLGEKLPAFARKRSTFAQNVSCFSCRWCAVVWDSSFGGRKICTFRFATRRK